MKSIYKRISTREELDTLITYCERTKYCSFDFETTGLKYYDGDYPTILGVSFQPGSSWIIPLGHKDSVFKDNWQEILIYFGKRVLENTEIVKVGWNLKFEYKVCMNYGIFPKGRLLDAMLAKYLLDEENPHDLKSFVKGFFPDFAGYEDDLKKVPNFDWANPDLESLSKYCGLDCDLTLRAMVYMEPKLIKFGFYSLFRNMLMMAVRVFAELEFRGFMVDKPYLENLMKEYEVKIANQRLSLRNDPALLKYELKKRKENIKELIKKVQLEIQSIIKENKPTAARLIANRENKIKGYLEGKFNNKEKWENLNLGSPTQIRDFFFDSKYGLKLKPHKYTDSGGASTDEESLLALIPKDKTGFMEKLLELRALEKLNSTYIEGMYKHVDSLNRIHAGFKIHGTVTGRLSCTNPNLQNIPRGSTAADIKIMFVPPPGYLMMEVDYGQAELRIIAHMSHDKAMLDIFKRGYNIHVATACKLPVPKGTPTKLSGLKDYDAIKEIIAQGELLGGKELEKPENAEKLFWVKQKKKGKSLNFSIVYQQGDCATAQKLSCSIDEAKKFKKDWFKMFPDVEKWIHSQKRFAHKNGWVKNLFGGKRRLYDINCGIFGKEAEAERQCVNAPVQGSSGYFTILSMIIIREKILKGELPRDLFMTYSVHDSIGFYIRPKYIHEVVPQILKICNNPETQKYFGFEFNDVVMKVSPEIGLTWEGLKKYDSNADYSKWLKNDKK